MVLAALVGTVGGLVVAAMSAAVEALHVVMFNLEAFLASSNSCLFSELADAAVPANIDGISVVAALKGKQLENPHEHLYWDYGHCRDRHGTRRRPA